MPARKSTRVVAIALVMTALLMFAVGLDSAWHHHDRISAANCPICHLSHQVVNQPHAGQRVYAPVPVGTAAVRLALPCPCDPLFPLTPSRAPPFA